MMNEKEIEKFLILKEPQSPGAMARLTPLELSWLQAQRDLRQAWEIGDLEMISDSLKELGHFESTSEPCFCDPLIIQVGGKDRQISNLFPVKEYPQGKLYRCSDCGDEFLSSEPPTELNRIQEKALIDYPNHLQGGDHEVLPLS